MQSKSLIAKIKHIIIRGWRVSKKKDLQLDTRILKRAGKKTKLQGFELIFRRVMILVGSALIAVSLIILQGFISLTHLDIAQFVSVICFSISIPLLACILMIFNFELAFKQYSPSISRLSSDSGISLVAFMFGLGMFLAGVGVASTLWHLSVIASFLFAFIILIMVRFIVGYFADMENLKIEDEEEQWD